jgi:Flp pilus assembly protein TadG
MFLHRHNAHRVSGRRSQRGAALPLVAVGLVAMLAVAGLALDASHSVVNKTRLQNTVDAAALAAAKQYDQAADIVAANAAALQIFGLNADGAGNHELNADYDANGIAITIQWSETLNPFVNTGVGPYVRVIASDYDTATSLTAVLGIMEIDIAASAVAGPSPTVNTACNIAPLVACALDPDDPNLFGFSPNQVEVLKSGSGGSSEVGPGNFQLIRLGCSGGNCVRDNIAGGYDGCIDLGETVETEPGNTVGPTVQGLNTRFGVYTGSMTPEDYPPDVITTQPSTPLEYDSASDTVHQNGTVATASTIDYGWSHYISDIAGGIGRLTNPPPQGVYERRVLTIPIARCDGGATGQSTLDIVGFGCYFMLQQMVQQGTEAQIYGQFIQGCTAGGTPGPNPVSGPDPYIIQLYKDPDSGDS